MLLASLAAPDLRSRTCRDREISAAKWPRPASIPGLERGLKIPGHAFLDQAVAGDFTVTTISRVNATSISGTVTGESPVTFDRKFSAAKVIPGNQLRGSRTLQSLIPLAKSHVGQSAEAAKPLRRQPPPVRPSARGRFMTTASFHAKIGNSRVREVWPFLRIAFSFSTVAGDLPLLASLPSMGTAHFLLKEIANRLRDCG